jgi:hypothetical protein
MNRILLVVLVFLLQACSQSVDVVLEPEVSVYISSDSQREINLTANEAPYIELQNWLDAHKEGWHSTSGRYADGIYIASGEWGVQVIDSHVVLYTTAKAKPSAIYIQKLEKGKLSALQNFRR